MTVEPVVVFPEVEVVDAAGNIVTRPSSVGIVCRASIPTLRLVGWKGAELGSGTQIGWRGQRFTIDGGPVADTGSPR